jgi:acetoin utilization protein AcuB
MSHDSGDSARERLGRARDWMTRAPVSVPPDAPVARVAGLMRAGGIRHVLVLDGDRLAGIVSNRDVRGLLVEGESAVLPGSPVARVMTEHPVTVAADAPLTLAARVLLDRKIGALPVLDGDRVVGILSLADVLEAFLAWAEPGGQAGGD